MTPPVADAPHNDNDEDRRGGNDDNQNVETVNSNSNNSSNIDLEEEEEEDECRVCRGPAEEGHPLFHPCKCSGSIGLTHQDCLQSWLAVQPRSSSNHDGRCELCHYQFQFVPQYDSNAPATIPFHEVIYGIVHRRIIRKWCPVLIRSILAASLWLIIAPLCTAYLYHGWMARPSVILERTGSYSMIINDLISGGVVAAAIIVSFLSLMSFADFLRVEWQQQNQRRQRQRGNNNNNRQQRGDAVVNDVNDAAAGPPQPLHLNNNNNAGDRRPQDHHHADNRGEEAAAADEDDVAMEIDNAIWEYAQQWVLSQPSERIRRQQLRKTIWRSPVDDGTDDEDNHNDDAADEDDDDDEIFNPAADSESDPEELESDFDVIDDDDDEDVDDAVHEIPDFGRFLGPAMADAGIIEHEEDDNIIINNDNNNHVGRGPQPPPPRPALRRPNQRNDNRAADPIFDMMVDPDEPIEMDINIALDELLGVRGPFLVVARNLMWLLAFNAVYLGCFAFVPRTVGMVMCSVMFNATTYTVHPTSSSIEEGTMNSTTDVNMTGTTTLVTNLTETFRYNVSESFSLVNLWRAIDAESMRHNTAFRLHDIATVALGYLSLACAIILIRFLWYSSKKVPFLRSARARMGNHHHQHPAAAPDANNNDVIDAFDEINRVVHDMAVGGNNNMDGAAAAVAAQFDIGGGGEHHGVALSVAFGMALDALIAIVKVCVLLFLKMFLLPIILGLALDASTLRLLGNTLEDRITYAGQDIFSFMLLHWVAGITFMLLVTVSVLQLREVAHPDLLAHMIRPQEPQPDLLGNLLHESVSTHSKRMVLSLIIYAFLLTVHIYLPIRCGMLSWIFGDPSRGQVHLKFNYILWPQLQVPLELLFFHICMLALLEKYKNGLGGMQHYWLKFMARLMGLSDRVLPHQVGEFRLIGTKLVFNEGRKVDQFWLLLASDRIPAGRVQAAATIAANISSFRVSNTSGVHSLGETKPSGERVLRLGADCIRLPVRLPGNTLRSRSTLLRTRFGKYRLQSDFSDAAEPVIQLWEEIPGASIPRPPEGWDDLGAGGANVQGRWAWGSEKKSTIELGVAHRRPFFDKKQTLGESIVIGMKLLALGVLSWFAVSTILCIVVATPLLVGRSLYYILRIPDRWIHDPLAFDIGFLILFPLVRKTTRLIMSSNVSVYQNLKNWLRRFHAPPPIKALVLIQTIIMWFGVSPLLLGLCYDIVFIKPDAWFTGQLPIHERILSDYSVLSWLSGTVLLDMWSDLCLRGVLTKAFSAWVLDGRDNNNNGAPAADAAGAVVDNDDDANNAANDADNGVNNDNRDDVEQRNGWQGKHGRISRFWRIWKSILTSWKWDRIDPVVLLRDCAIPVVVALCWTLFVPLGVLGLCSWQFASLPGRQCAILVRSTMAMTICIQVGRAWKDQLRQLLKMIHKTARDDRYLIGEVLMNHPEA